MPSRQLFRPRLLVHASAVALCGLCLGPAAAPAAPLGPSDAAYWASAIAHIERRDAARPSRHGSVLFVGSSSIRRWSSLREDMQPLAVRNHGFGGAEIAHITHYADRLVLPQRPRGIVFYAGDNDLARHAELSAERLLEHFVAFLDTLERAGQAVPVYFLSIKPSPARFRHWPRFQRANRLFARFAARHPRVTFVDVASAMLDAAGRPRPELYHRDGLHLSRKGYAVWSSALRPLLVGGLGVDAS